MGTDRSDFLENYLPYLLRRADQMMSTPFYATLTRRGVARSEWRVLAVLYDSDQLPVVELAAETFSPQPTVTHALRRLEERGLVTRSLGADDRRQRFISLTPTGKQLTAELIEVAARLERDMLAEVGDVGDLYERLRDLADRLQGQVGQSLEEVYDGNH